jgi:hypothetical protein
MSGPAMSGGEILPPRVHEVPPAPLWSTPDSAGRVDAEGYVWGSPASRYAIDGADRRRSGRARFLTPFASRVALGLCVALFAWSALLCMSSLLLWIDAEVPQSGLGEAVVGYGICALVVLAGMAAPGRWRAVFTAAVAVFGALLPLYLARDLVDTLGVSDVWVGQSLTFGVMFPLVVGGGATVALLRTPGWR